MSIATNNKTRIGVIVDGTVVPFWVASVIRSLVAKDTVEVCFLGQTGAGAAHESGTCRYAYSLYRRMDRRHARKYLEEYPDTDITQDIGALSGLESRIRLSDKGLSIQLDPGVRESAELDVILYLGQQRINAIETADTGLSRYGTWYLGPGDGRRYSDACPGFWEVHDNSPDTHISLLASAGNGGVTRRLYRTNVRTVKTSVAVNQRDQWLAGIRLIDDAVDYIATARPTLQVFEEKFHCEHDVSGVTRGEPGPLNLLFFVAAVLGKRFLGRRLKKVNSKPDWVIGITGRDNVDLLKGSLGQPVWTQTNPSYYVADPFPYAKDGTGYVFMEIVEKAVGKGAIAVSTLLEGNRLSSPKTIIEEDWHLSFPFLLEDGEQLYMLPEQGASGDLWFYRCLSFPDQWQREGKLLRNIHCVDAVFHFHEGRWWCFLSRSSAGLSQNNLYIYYSDDIFRGDWTAHAMNPVHNDLRGSRMAGRITQQDGKLLRPGQNSLLRYGGSTVIYEILVLTPEQYEERELCEIYPPDNVPGNIRMHTINFSGQIAAVDGTCE